MKIIHKFIMILITLAIDSAFIYILNTDELTSGEKMYIYANMIIHLFFIFALIFDVTSIIDVSHIFLFLSIYCGIIIQNHKLLLVLALLASTQIALKYLFIQCIMSTKEESMFGEMIDRYNQNFVYITLLIILYKIFL
tara:strand:- start:1104 stop:1517 length:414 start_codon:yes stop_codon:yes gene_type:complete